MNLIIAVLVLLTTSVPGTASGIQRDSLPPKPPGITVYLFWGNGCPHCEKEKDFLKGLKERYPGMEVKDYEVWYDRANKAFFERIMHSVRAQAAAVPATVVGKKLFIGFTEQTATAIENAIALCLEEGCTDAIGAMTGRRSENLLEEHKAIRLPFLGEVDPDKISLPAFTVMIGALDSFNPCAFFVLLFLLSMLIHARSRKKMVLIGAIFVFFSAFIYFLFMAAWLNIFLVIGRLTAITVTAGVVALIIAALNIKDFFFFKKGVSLVIPEKSRPKLFERMRNLLKSSSLPAMLGGTIVLAATANAYELLCTAGFPMVYTRTLTLHNLTTAEYYLYLVLYNIVYVIPLAVIVIIITTSLGARKLTEWQGRQLKLISGLMMLFLGLILLVEPPLLNNALASGVLLAAVILVSGITIYAAKKIRPEITAE
jgi:thiol-disulfide isomerase/thioredoxin